MDELAKSSVGLIVGLVLGFIMAGSMAGSIMPKAVEGSNCHTYSHLTWCVVDADG